MDAKRFDDVRSMPDVTVSSTVRTAFPACGLFIVAIVFIQAPCGAVGTVLLFILFVETAAFSALFILFQLVVAAMAGFK